MVTTLALLSLLSCRMTPAPRPPPPEVTRCEGADRVTTVRGVEVRRQVRACVVTRCEGADAVTRTFAGTEVGRDARACGAPQTQPLRFGLVAR